MVEKESEKEEQITALAHVLRDIYSDLVNILKKKYNIHHRKAEVIGNYFWDAVWKGDCAKLDVTREERFAVAIKSFTRAWRSGELEVLLGANDYTHDKFVI